MLAHLLLAARCLLSSAAGHAWPAAALLLATGGLLSSAAGHAWPAVICCRPRVANWELSRPRVAYSDR